MVQSIFRVGVRVERGLVRSVGKMFERGVG